MQFIKKLYTLFEKFKLIGALISGISIFGMMLLIAMNVIGRNFFGFSITGVYEITTYYFMPLSAFPALPYVYSSGVLPNMDLLLNSFNKIIKKNIIIIVLLIEFIIFSLAIYYTFHYALNSLIEGRTFVAGLKMFPLYPTFFLVPISFSMIFIEILFIIIKNFTEKHTSLIWRSRR